MSNVENAVDLFGKGLSCSQAVLTAYGPRLGLETEMAMKVASTFGGGIGRTGETCGAVTGALMALGLKYDKDDPEGKAKSIGRAKVFMDKFKERHNTVKCKELLQCDISTPEGMARSKDEKITANLCPRFIRNAAEILEEML